MIDNLSQENIRVFVFGTLRVGERLDFYMKGSKLMGLYYLEGQLMKSEMGSAYIDLDMPNTATIGELHLVNFSCLQRINHLEAVSGEFPKGYDLDIRPIWPYTEGKSFDFNPVNSQLAFFYKRRSNPIKVLSGDWTKHKDPIYEIGKYLRQNTSSIISDNELITYMQKNLLV